MAGFWRVSCNESQNQLNLGKFTLVTWHGKAAKCVGLRECTPGWGLSEVGPETRVKKKKKKLEACRLPVVSRQNPETIRLDRMQTLQELKDVGTKNGSSQGQHQASTTSLCVPSSIDSEALELVQRGVGGKV